MPHITLLKTKVFSVEEHLTPSHNLYYKIRCGDWVNILPITPEGRCILIKQHRFGINKDTVEVPGGKVDPYEAPEDAIVRELEEETGYKTDNLVFLGSLPTNPALLTNEMHFFLGLDCYPEPDRTRFPEKNEDIEIFTVSVNELKDMVQSGKINHCLSALCISLALEYKK